MKKQTPEQLRETMEALEAAVALRRFHKLKFYQPYPKQKDFHALGATKRERLFMAGTQLGKTESGAAEVAYHLTGEYPDWWTGRRFDHPVKFWVCGKTAVMTRDFPQQKLFGTPGVNADKGTGYVPKDAIIDISLGRGVTDGYDTVQVQHKTDGIADGVSTVTFKSYDSGRQNLQGSTLDGVWLDEECDEGVYAECQARITATDGFVFMTFTPLLGRTKVVLRYLNEPSPDRAVVHMTIEECPHMQGEKGRKAAEGYLEHEREARTMGVPFLGSGAIFPLPEASVKEPCIDYVPSHWCKIWGVDFGIGHPFAAALLLWDKDTDIIHVHHTIRMRGSLPINHAAAMKSIGADVPVAWPHDGVARDKGSGVALASQYRAEGLRMMHEHATWPEGGFSTEAGIEEMRGRERNGKLKIAAHLSEYLEERRFYHREDGLIVKEMDDILSSTRVGIMMKRHAKPVLLGNKRAPRDRGGNTMCKGVDFDPF